MAQAVLPNVREDQISLDFIPVSAMAVDPVYQRNLEAKRIQRLVADWNDLACGVVYVSKRGATYYIIDGQHRWAAADQLGKLTLPALVLVNLSAKVEADLFVYYNKNRRIASMIDVFRAEVAKGDPVAKSITKTLELHNLKVGPSPDSFRGVSTARKIHDRFGWEVLAAVLGTTMRAWPNDVPGATDTHIMMGIAALYSYYGASKFEFPTMEVGLRSTTRNDIIRAVNARRVNSTAGRRNVTAGVCDVLVELYNTAVGRGRHTYKLSIPRSSAVFVDAMRAYRWEDGGLSGAPHED